MISLHALVARIPGRWINYFAVAGIAWAIGRGWEPVVTCFWR